MDRRSLCAHVGENICKRPGCGKATWDGRPNGYCSKTCRDGVFTPVPTCLAAGCAKPTWNGRPNGYCSKDCRDRAQKLGLTPPDLKLDPQAWFRFFDKDGNGMQQHELVTALAQTFSDLDFGSARELVSGLWSSFDTDRSGSICLHEFLKRGGLRDALLAQLEVGRRQRYGYSKSASFGASSGASPSYPAAGKGASSSLPAAGKACIKAGGAKSFSKGGSKASDSISDRHGGDATATFDDVLRALRPFWSRMGKTPNYGRGDPSISGKMKGGELAKTSDYEYVYLTVLGFSALQLHGKEIVALNNGKHYKSNPGTQLMERCCGFTMHGDRAGANAVVRSAPEALLEAFGIARRKSMLETFFTGQAFDRTADPCLEGRLGRMYAFLELHGSTEVASDAEPPPGDVVLELQPAGSPVEKVVGEYLRVFRNTCIYKWAQDNKLSYQRARELWESSESGSRIPGSTGAPMPDVKRLFNDATFLKFLEDSGVVLGKSPSEGRLAPSCRFSFAEVRRAVAFFVEMETLNSA